MNVVKFSKEKTPGHYRYTHAYTGDYAVVRSRRGGWSVRMHNAKGRRKGAATIVVRTHAQARALVELELTEA